MILKKVNINKKRQGIVENSLILGSLIRFADYFYDSMGRSIAGKILSDTPEENDAENTGLIGSLLARSGFRHKVSAPLKRFFNRAFAESFLLNAVRRFMHSLLSCPMRSYGVLGFSFGIYTVLAYFIMRYALSLESFAVTNLYVGIGVILVSIPALASRLPLNEAIFRSGFVSFILFRCLGLQPEKMVSSGKSAPRSSIFFILGMIIGALTVFLDPLYFILAACGILVMYTLLCRPEVGVLLIIALLPFLPTMYLAALIIVVFCCWFLKYIQGRRTFKLRKLDIIIAAFMFILLGGGLISVSPGASLKPALLYICLMLGYFLVVNLIKTLEWAYRCVGAAVISAFGVAALGIYENFFGTASLNWIDQTMFEEIEGRVVSTFANPNVLAEYLIMVLPFSASVFFFTKKPGLRLGSLIAFCVTALCLVYTWSRGAWLGFLIGAVIFFIIYSRRSMVFMFFCVLAVPFLPLVLPSSVVSRFLSIGNLKDSSTAYRVNIWKGCINMIKDYFFEGIGVGQEAFRAVYPKYSLSGIEAAPHAHNLYLQIVLQIGIVGLIVFIGVIFLFLRSNLTFFRDESAAMRPSRLLTAAGFCGIAAVLVQGMTDYIWYNYRIFCMFWLVLGITTALRRCAAAEKTFKAPEEPYLDLMI